MVWVLTASTSTSFSDMKARFGMRGYPNSKRKATSLDMGKKGDPVPQPCQQRDSGGRANPMTLRLKQQMAWILVLLKGVTRHDLRTHRVGVLNSINHFASGDVETNIESIMVRVGFPCEARNYAPVTIHHVRRVAGVPVPIIQPLGCEGAQPTLKQPTTLATANRPLGKARLTISQNVQQAGRHVQCRGSHRRQSESGSADFPLLKHSLNAHCRSVHAQDQEPCRPVKHVTSVQSSYAPLSGHRASSKSTSWSARINRCKSAHRLMLQCI